MGFDYLQRSLDREDEKARDSSSYWQGCYDPISWRYSNNLSENEMVKRIKTLHRELAEELNVKRRKKLEKSLDLFHKYHPDLFI